MPILQGIQAEYGWLSPDVIGYVARAVGLLLARVYGVAAFYTHFTLKPKGKHVIKLCNSAACHVKGSMKLLTALRRHLNLGEGEDTSGDGLFTVNLVSCLGACGLAPVMVVDNEVHGQVRPEQIGPILDTVLANDKKQAA